MKPKKREKKKTFYDQDIIDLIVIKNKNQALKFLTIRHCIEFLPIIRSNTKHLSLHEHLSIYYDAFLYFCDKVSIGAFKFTDDDAFISYFKESCKIAAKKFNRTFRPKQLVLPNEIKEYFLDDLADAEECARREFIEMHPGIDIPILPDDGADLFNEIIRIFPLMNDECKFLLVLKYFLKLTHKEIVIALSSFFQIQNERVSITSLHRCYDFIRQRAQLQ
jgi:hypothetical protein